MKLTACLIILCLLFNSAFSLTDIITATETVDLNRFTQLLSHHLLYEHFDKAYLQLSKKISLQFRNAIHVKIKRVPNSQKAIVPVDVQILKRQLKGAVGSFIEDKLPAILTTRHDTNNLKNQLDDLIYEYCSDSITQNATMSQACLLENQHEFLLRMHGYINREVQDILYHVDKSILPKLFEKTRAQMSGILIHFNQHIMDPLHHELELKQKHGNDHHWITEEIIQEFISILNHAEEEEENNIKSFLDLSK
ncbi:unnamed protein product [Rhizopus stolonifer]